MEYISLLFQVVVAVSAVDVIDDDNDNDALAMVVKHAPA